MSTSESTMITVCCEPCRGVEKRSSAARSGILIAREHVLKMLRWRRGRIRGHRFLWSNPRSIRLRISAARGDSLCSSSLVERTAWSSSR